MTSTPGSTLGPEDETFLRLLNGLRTTFPPPRPPDLRAQRGVSSLTASLTETSSLPLYKTSYIPLAVQSSLEGLHASASSPTYVHWEEIHQHWRRRRLALALRRWRTYVDDAGGGGTTFSGSMGGTREPGLSLSLGGSRAGATFRKGAATTMLKDSIRVVALYRWCCLQLSTPDLLRWWGCLCGRAPRGGQHRVDPKLVQALLNQVRDVV
jgi:hypothetical protein